MRSVIGPSPGRRPHGVRDLRAYLCGSWRVSRKLWDKKRQQCGVFHGTVAFSQADDALLYREQGRLRFGGFEGFAYRGYRFEFTSRRRARIRFDDGRLFHFLDLTSGHFETTYDCGLDEYLGVFTALASDRWEARWRVRGVRKDLLIDSHYTKSEI